MPLVSEAGLVRALWPLVRDGALADITRREADLVRAASPSEGEHGADDLVDRVRDGQDPLGDALLRLRSPRRRRALGATYTPQEIIAPMTSWIARHGDPARVVDPGAGSARFEKPFSGP